VWVRDVELPEALVDAHRAGDLVIFVGAGASRDEPSGLPDFRALTIQIATEARTEVTEQELERPDVLLGRIANQQVDVHQRVKEILANPASRPDELHATIVDLALAGPPARIVTTNYDRHLSRVLADRGVAVEEYLAPALPMGDDFTGLVYLHGSLSQSPENLVVTDADFGRAYLTDAWAARFLERMFRKYTVVFIGYSHADLVMRYLARALVPGAQRYILTSLLDQPDWHMLGVHPVGYQVVDGSHYPLREAVGAWASSASMGLLDHRQRVAQLVSGPPSEVPEEVSYLEATVADDNRASFFAEFARGEEWLMWASKQEPFRCLFEPAASTESTSRTVTLAYWFAEHFVMNAALSAYALGFVGATGGRLGPTVWSAIGHRLHMGSAPRPDWLRPWLLLLVENAPQAGHPWLDYALAACIWPADRSDAFLLFSFLTEPRAVLRPSYGLRASAGFDIKLRGQAHTLRQAFQTIFRPNLEDAAATLLSITDRQIRQAHQLLVAGESAGRGWDPISFGRASIAPHAQNWRNDALDVLVDAARDALAAELAGDGEAGPAQLELWSDSDVPMLRRLALHGWTIRTDVSDTEKIAWLNERGWLFDYELRHEVFALIAAALPGAGEVANRLVADAAAGPTAVADEGHRGYERFQALKWMSRHAPGLHSAQEALEQVQGEYPGLEEGPYPDFVSASGSGFVAPRLPMTAADLHQRIQNDVEGAIRELLRYKATTPPFDGTTWYDAIAVLVEDVHDQPRDGFAVLDSPNADDPDIVRGVIRGWGTAATLDDDTAEAVLARLTQVDLAVVADQLASFLADGGENETTPTAWRRFKAARTLAIKLWAALEEEQERPPSNSPLGEAISSPAGRLTLFWVRALSAEWQAAGDNWRGLPEETRSQLAVLLDGDDERSSLAQVVLASQVFFFFRADRDWCDAHVLPLLDWADPDRARRAWDGYLFWGRWDDQLLRAGLLEHYLSAAAHIDELGEEARRNLGTHLAGIALYSELDPAKLMPAFTRTVAVSDRVEWMTQISWLLDRLPPEAIEDRWHRWMEHYWQERLQSIPVQLTFEEASAMSGWVIYLKGSLSAGVGLAIRHRAGLLSHSRVLDALDDPDRLSGAPALFAKLIAHLMAGTDPPFWDGYHLARIVPVIRPEADPVDVKRIIEEAIRLGVSEAPQWMTPDAR
jgi:hypothetical protein